MQNQPEENSEPRLQPLHCSTISWQIPPLYEHPLFVMKGHSIPSFKVVQTNVTTSFADNKNLKKGREINLPDLNKKNRNLEKPTKHNQAITACQYNFLIKLYELTQKNSSSQVSMHDLGEAIGLERDTALKTAEVVLEFGLAEIKTLAGDIGITEDGLSEAMKNFRFYLTITLYYDTQKICWPI